MFAMFGMGMQELLIVGVIAVLLFGRKLPEVARSLGSSYSKFRQGLNEIQSSVHEAERYATSDTYSSHSSSSGYDDYDDYEEATAPKFEPPPSEPQSSETSSSKTPSSKTQDAAPSLEKKAEE